MKDRGDLILTKPIKIEKQVKRNPRGNRATCCLPTQVEQNSEKIWWMMKFQNMETLTPVPLMKHLQRTYSRDVRIWGKHSVYTHFPKDRNCEICKRTKITRAPCRRRNGEAVPRTANFGDLITADHKVPKRRLRISKQSSIRSRGAGLGHPMDPGLSVQNKNFTGNSKKLAKVFGAR